MSEFTVSTEPNIIYNLEEGIEREEMKGQRMSEDEAYAIDMVTKYKSKKMIDDPLATLTQLYLTDVLRPQLITPKQKEDNYTPLRIDEFCSIQLAESLEMQKHVCVSQISFELSENVDWWFRETTWPIQKWEGWKSPMHDMLLDLGTEEEESHSMELAPSLL